MIRFVVMCVFVCVVSVLLIALFCSASACASASASASATDQVTEYFWRFEVKWELQAFKGAGSAGDLSVTLQKRTGSIELKTLAESTPRPAVVVQPNIDVNITWLLNRLSMDKHQTTFLIDRTDVKRCHTPRRNPEVDQALSFWQSLSSWCNSVRHYFMNSLLPVQADHGLNLGSAQDDSSLFVPVQPLFEKDSNTGKSSGSGGSGSDSKDEKSASFQLIPAAAAGSGSDEKGWRTGSGVVPLSLVNSFLSHQRKSLSDKRAALQKTFPSNDKIVTFAEAWIVMLVTHTEHLCQSARDGVDYIEDMLYKQLVAAIGKVVQPIDFQAYARFHMRKLYRAEYQPRPFSYAIRRAGYYPEGTLSIEAAMDDGSMPDPIHTVAAAAQATRPMYFPLDASTRVSFMGDRYVHGWINQQFSGNSGLRLNLIARARQFSSFILLVGRISGADTFDPKYGIIIQNKDDLKIPLLMETIPTPKEFKDAIESLSPEQQRFAKGFRAMQLESTLFGVCVIQIKPALEKVLNLNEDALTKEIELTQDLLSLFIEYQIPSDLLSFSEKAHPSGSKADTQTRLNTVRGFVQNMQAVIAKNKVLHSFHLHMTLFPSRD